MSLRCGCPVDTSAKQKHRPSRQARPPQGARQSVLFQGELRIFLRTLKKHIVKKPLIQRFFKGTGVVPTGIECSPKISDFRANGIPVGERVDFFDTLTGCKSISFYSPFQYVKKLSLRCGCPVDTSAKQKHRPSRQEKPPLGARQSFSRTLCHCEAV